jgi:lipopolysaccharide/colanic/teichoic acid biosynthesis glycosyltransferase
MKRLFDILFSALGIVILIPVFVVVAVLIKIKMPDGKVIFTQQRVGQFGKLFTMYKFRTMVAVHSGSTVSVKGESRITPFGTLLRKYKLDELPELWNVLRGEMSFVGPRPDVEGYADKLQGEDREILRLKPGITGAASLKYRNEEDILAKQKDPINYNDTVIFPDKVRINLYYLRNRHFWLDIKIIIYTIFGQDIKELY